MNAHENGQMRKAAVVADVGKTWLAGAMNRCCDSKLTFPRVNESLQLSELLCKVIAAHCLASSLFLH
jgi:hypothetical protein